jgi:hypothetical protein
VFPEGPAKSFSSDREVRGYDTMKNREGASAEVEADDEMMDAPL